MSEKKGKTLFEILTEKLGFGTKEPEVPPPWKRICNPMDAIPGQYLQFDILDFRGKDFRIQEVAELAVDGDGKTRKMCQLKGECGAETVWLLIIPTSNGANGILFTPYDSFGADTEDGRAVIGYKDGDEWHGGCVEDPAKNFKVDVKDVHEEYFRVDDVGSSYLAKTLTVDSDSVGAEPVEGEVEYWDYWRQTPVEGVDLTQYVYVVQDTGNGWVTIKRGEQIDLSRVTKY